MSLLREWWGPRFWKILHTLAECSGSMNSTILSNDEAELWKILLKIQGFVMPCTLCKNHYLEWYRIHGINTIGILQGEQRRKFIRHWLLSCHNNVNITTQKPELSEENLSELYKKESISVLMKDIYEMFRIALERSHLKIEDVNRWKHAVVRLRLLYSI